jgi:hypothetical protein
MGQPKAHIERRPGVWTENRVLESLESLVLLLEELKAELAQVKVVLAVQRITSRRDLYKRYEESS